jgi:hypothetical protein
VYSTGLMRLSREGQRLKARSFCWEYGIAEAMP